MSSSQNSNWTRREWMAAVVAHTSALAVVGPMPRWRGERVGPPRTTGIPHTSRLADAADLQELVRKAVEAAQSFGARYADARLTRVVCHNYHINGGDYAPVMTPQGGAGHAILQLDTEQVGLGVRALVNGAWGFAAAPLWIGDPTWKDAVASIAKDAVRQAKATSGGAALPVELAAVPAVTGHWSTPIRIDPFSIPIEEKVAMVGYWKALATNAGVQISVNSPKYLAFTREERALATSDGTLLTQVLYETGGLVTVEQLHATMRRRNGGMELPVTLPVERIFSSAAGWELFDQANMQQQFEYMHDELPRRVELREKARFGDVGRYTIVCDGETMASLLEHTLGTATQLDRAMAYEANASGTSFITEPLESVGQLRLAPDAVTVTANRNTPGQLATVQWDDEGVEPRPFTLVKQGMLVDFQTTREQASWLAPYYERIGRPVRSNGCSAAEDALFLPVQHMPNLSLEPAPTGPDLDGLISTVKKGVYLERCKVTQMDSQGRWGLVATEWGDRTSRTREIVNGRLGAQLNGMGLAFDATELWKHTIAVGGATTRGTLSTTGHDFSWSLFGYGKDNLSKGAPPQVASHTVQAAAAVIENQALIDPSRRA